jgi:hypothetical protein
MLDRGMALEGSITTMPVEDLLDWLERRMVSGELRVRRGTAQRTFQLAEGYLTAASSDDPANHLGQVLLRHGLVSEDALNDAYRVQADTGVALGKILLMVGAVDKPSLSRAIESKISEEIYEVLTWGEGSFVFEPSLIKAVVSEFEVRVGLRVAIDEGRRRAAAWRKIWSLIPDDEVRLWIKDAHRLAQAAATSRVADLASAVERGLTVAEITLEQSADRYDVMRELAVLVQQEVLAVDARSQARPDPDLSAAQLAEAARGRAQAGDRAGAFDLAQRALQKNPEDAGLQKLAQELERSLFAELSRSLLTSFRVPKLLKTKDELESLPMNKAERYLVARVDGRWDLLSLMRVSPLREVEALITFKRLADRGIISL